MVSCYGTGYTCLLTRYGVPVSTSFLVLSAFASTFVLEKMLMKSIMGYGIAALFAYGAWYVISRWMDETAPVKEEHKNYWRIAQWLATGGLWWTWLSHDMANIAVFLPRQVPVDLMFLVSVVFVVGLFFMFRERGGKIQEIVLEKHNTRYVRSATLIDLFYWLCLYFFKELNDIPMSTTWVFVGMLAGTRTCYCKLHRQDEVQECVSTSSTRLSKDDDRTRSKCCYCISNTLCTSTKRILIMDYLIWAAVAHIISIVRTF